MKRLLGCVSASLAIAATPLVPAPAQAQAADKPEAIVCQLLDNCSGSTDAAPDKRPVRRGEVRGFSLARPKSAMSATSPSPETAPHPGSTGMATASHARSKPAKAAPHGQYDLRVAFMTGSADVNPMSRDQVSAFATALKDPRLAARKIRIEGHTDSVGAAAKNQDLSERRAKAIADMLQAQGVDTTRLDVKGYGSTRPLPGTQASNGANRRVVAVLEN